MQQRELSISNALGVDTGVDFVMELLQYLSLWLYDKEIGEGVSSAFS